MKIHELKCWPEYFEAVWDGTKPFEVRKNDRDFKVGDLIWLREFHPGNEGYEGMDVVQPDYTGRGIKNIKITYVLEHKTLLPPGVVVLGFKLPS